MYFKNPGILLVVSWGLIYYFQEESHGKVIKLKVESR